MQQKVKNNFKNILSFAMSREWKIIIAQCLHFNRMQNDLQFSKQLNLLYFQNNIANFTEERNIEIISN